jgi:CxxC-x17-CxxC domain-containing protein
MADKFTPQPYDHDHENEVMPFAATNFRNKLKKFGIKTDDRRRHVYIVGKTGMGKTTLLENMFLHDVLAGHGCCYVDPHGDTAEKLLDYIPPNRINDVVYFNPSDMNHPIGFNIFEIKNEGQKHLVAAGLMAVFKKIWEGVWSSRMEYILLNTILALLDAPGSTLLGINRMLSDEEYRKRVVSLVQDPVVKTFWVKEFAAFSEKYRTEAVAPVQNKVGQFLSASIIRNIVAQVKSTMNLREIMDNRKILILNLSKGLVGEENSRLLGAMVITRLQLAAMERVDQPESERQDFYLYVDEFQNFATESFATILSEARKYRLSLTVAHQYIEQLDETVAAAIFGNVGTLITFRVGSPDAIKLVQEFTPRFTEEDLVNLKKFEIYLKLMIDGASSEPFSANTLPPIAQRTGSTDKVIKVSRERYSTQRDKIEDKVLKWSGMGTVDTGETIKTDEEQAEAAAKADSSPSPPPVDPDLSDEEKELEAKIKELQASSPNIPAAAPSGGKKKKEAKYEMPCSVCGKVSKLTFEPDRSRPWYCKEHLEEKQKGGLRPPPGAAPPPRSAPPRPEAPPPRRPMNPPTEPDAPAQAAAAPVSLSALKPTGDQAARPDKPQSVRSAPPSRTDAPPPSGPPPRSTPPPTSAPPPVDETPATPATETGVKLSALDSGRLVRLGSDGRPKPDKPTSSQGRSRSDDGRSRPSGRGADRRSKDSRREDGGRSGRNQKRRDRPGRQDQRSQPPRPPRDQAPPRSGQAPMPAAPAISDAKPAPKDTGAAISLSALAATPVPEKAPEKDPPTRAEERPAAEPPTDTRAAEDSKGTDQANSLKPGQVIKFD